MQSILKVIFARAQQSNGATALVVGESVISYGMLVTGVCSLALEISKLSLSLDRPIGVQVANPARHVMVCLALGLSGHCAASLTRETSQIAVALGVQAVICDERDPSVGVPQHILTGAWFQNPVEPVWRFSTEIPDRVRRVEFTSGTTGRPKALGLTDDALLMQTLNRITSYALSESRCLSLFRPTANVGFGFALAGLSQGRTVYYGDNNDAFLDMINHHQIECIAGSPAQLNALVSRLIATGRHGTNVRKIILAGSLPSNAELRQIRSAFGGSILIDYGSSETGPVAIAAGDGLNLHEDGFPVFSPLQTVEEMEAGEREIRMRSTGMARPFTGDLRQAPATDGDNWFYPGDTGHLTADGRLVLSGRKGGVVNIGGVKIALEAMEESLRSVSGVLDVAVAPVKTSAARAVVHVALVASRDIPVADLRSALAARFDNIDIGSLLRVAEIPRNAGGKVDRTALSILL